MLIICQDLKIMCWCFWETYSLQSGSTLNEFWFAWQLYVCIRILTGSQQNVPCRALFCSLSYLLRRVVSPMSIALIESEPITLLFRLLQAGLEWFGSAVSRKSYARSIMIRLSRRLHFLTRGFCSWEIKSCGLCLTVSRCSSANRALTCCDLHCHAAATIRVVSDTPIMSSQMLI